MEQIEKGMGGKVGPLGRHGGDAQRDRDQDASAGDEGDALGNAAQEMLPGFSQKLHHLPWRLSKGLERGEEKDNARHKECNISTPHPSPSSDFQPWPILPSSGNSIVSWPEIPSAKSTWRKESAAARPRLPGQFSASVGDRLRLRPDRDGNAGPDPLRRGPPGGGGLDPGQLLERPTWEKPVRVFHFLFGKRQIGISLVGHGGKADPRETISKIHFPNAASGPLGDLLRSLETIRGWQRPLQPYLETLIACCREMLAEAAARPPRKAIHTFEAVCLYVQENFSFPITRDSVARHFAIAPNHVSRLFQQQGLMRFNDYLTRVRIDRAKFSCATTGRPSTKWPPLRLPGRQLFLPRLQAIHQGNAHGVPPALSSFRQVMLQFHNK